MTPNSSQKEHHIIIENSRTEQETESAQPSRREPNTNFNWGTLSGQDFCKIINECYEEIVHWKRNLFLIPSGGAGKSFVTELARLFQAYADGSAMEDIALKACMVMQVMLLQRPHKNSRSRDHVSALSRRLNMWLNGEIATLLQEGRCLQARISSAPVQISEDKLARKFTNLISVGKIREALRCIEKSTTAGVLKIDDAIEIGPNHSPVTVLERLKQLHPQANPWYQIS